MHGTNAVVKVYPYIPVQDRFDTQMSMSDEDIKYMKEWGINFVRMGVMWEAVETAPGVYNTTYLEEMNGLITKLGKNGIYVLVDAHQDVWSRQLCGEGVPQFYLKDVSHHCWSFENIYGGLFSLLG